MVMLWALALVSLKNSQNVNHNQLQLKLLRIKRKTLFDHTSLANNNNSNNRKRWYIINMYQKLKLVEAGTVGTLHMEIKFSLLTCL